MPGILEFHGILASAPCYAGNRNWNQPSIDFYRSLGAQPMDEWTSYRLSGETLRNLAEL